MRDGTPRYPASERHFCPASRPAGRQAHSVQGKRRRLRDREPSAGRECSAGECRVLRCRRADAAACRSRIIASAGAPAGDVAAGPTRRWSPELPVFPSAAPGRARVRTACKPGSVPPRPRFPAGAAWMAIHLGPRLPAASCSPPGKRAGDGPGANPCFPYLTLLPVGLAVPPPLPGARWALTPPFHPCRATLEGTAADCSLWRFPWGCPRRALPGTVSPWSPDFPHLARPSRAEARPSSRPHRSASPFRPAAQAGRSESGRCAVPRSGGRDGLAPAGQRAASASR